MRGIPTEEESMIESGCFLTLNPVPENPRRVSRVCLEQPQEAMPKKQKPPSPALT